MSYVILILLLKYLLNFLWEVNTICLIFNCFNSSFSFQLKV